VPPAARIPREFRLLPFRGSEAVRAGALTWGQLRHAGWRRLLPDVYVAADVDLDHRLRCRAALVYAGAARPGVAISGLSAAACWGVDLLSAGSPVELTVDRGARVRSRPPDLRVIRSELASRDVTMIGSVTVTSPERTVLDVLRRSPRVDGIVLLDAMLQRRVVALSTLESASAAWCGRRGGAKIAAALRDAEPRSESPMETRTRLVIVDLSLPRPVAQYVIRDNDGRFVARVDLAYPVERVALEYEGDHHRERATFRRDIARVNALIALGWIVIRVTADDIYRNPEQLTQRIAEILRQRRA
jgi:very-short-patch-repair endonuclease